MQDKKLFDESIYKQIYFCDSEPASFHGVLKTHKMSYDSDNVSLRTSLSSKATYNYNLAKFLTELLEPVTPKEYCICLVFVMK